LASLKSFATPSRPSRGGKSSACATGWHTDTSTPLHAYIWTTVDNDLDPVLAALERLGDSLDEGW
jgi:hypothetical protein